MQMNLLFNDAGANVKLIPTHPVSRRNFITKEKKIAKNQRNIVFSTNELINPHVPGFADKIITQDPEFNMELTGRILDDADQIVVDDQLQPVSFYVIKEQLIRPFEQPIERDYKIRQGNIDQEIPVLISQVLFDPKEIFTQYVFRKSYFLTHTDQVSYKVLLNLAKNLDKEKKLAKISTFNTETKEISPLILHQGGILYSAVFLEGHVNENAEYALILHLSDYELKYPEFS